MFERINLLDERTKLLPGKVIRKRLLEERKGIRKVGYYVYDNEQEERMLGELYIWEEFKGRNWLWNGEILGKQGKHIIGQGGLSVPYLCRCVAKVFGYNQLSSMD